MNMDIVIPNKLIIQFNLQMFRRFWLGKEPDEKDKSADFEIDNIPDDKKDEAFKRLENAINTIAHNENSLLINDNGKNKWKK